MKSSKRSSDSYAEAGEELASQDRNTFRLHWQS